MEPTEIRAAWQPLQSPRQSPTSGLRSNLNLALSSPSPRRLREPAQEPSPQLGSHAPFAWAPIRPVTLDLGPPRTATHGMQLSPNVRPAPLGVRTIPTRRPGGNESRYGGSSPEEVGRECAASHVADEKERLRQARSKMAAPQADDELWENALLELAQKAEEELKLASELQAKFDALTMQNEQLQQELSQAAKREQATEKSEQALEAEKNELRKQLEDKEQEAKAKEAASQVQIELLKTELREAQQKAESRAAGKEAADEAYARRAEQDAEQTQESQEAQLELLKKDLKDAQQKAEEAKKAPESKEVQPSLPAESVGETSEMDTQKSDGKFLSHRLFRSFERLIWDLTQFQLQSGR
ncbi:unnamed protein product [Durusdinium trenchii]|uniref:Uncharacterized protein n=1 Tax=Durusdinium trenchii TaxID=1381693 RepID=A0ABP0M6X6_9DINO